MNENMLAQLLSQATSGDEQAREYIINHYKPFVINTVGHLSRKYVTWSDEESSVGLIALNRAIDTYKVNGGRSFLNYSYLLIKRDLIDFSRKERSQKRLIVTASEDEQAASTTFDIKQSMKSYHQEEEAKELVEEILEFSKVLNEFGVQFEELEGYTPKHRDTREMLLELVSSFIHQQDLVNEFMDKRRIPVTAFVSRTSFNIKTLERYRKYIVTLIILKLHPEWKKLSEYIQVPVGSGKQ
ncbi:RNA polymerase sigma-I factor [Litchfieldia alkalitelluris]|uniref:RNA polymerase sigma-I factor n=1 Tax=Litchfieldia alkalitelluris TaxID=304268 RepID=UPI000996BEE2|nr:RNA polymerase sigma-I factor [Litchfieldia alkalitelluris]